MPATIPTLIANNMFGPILVGGLLNSASWGMSCIQAYSYFSSSQRKFDIPIVQHAISAIVIMNTAHVAILAHVVYWYLIAQYGFPFSLLQIVSTKSAAEIVTEVMVALIRFLYARRVWKLSGGNRSLTFLLCVLAVANMSVGIALAVMTHQVPSTAQYYTAGGVFLILRRLVTALTSLHLVTETIFTTSICFYLFTMKSEIKKTNSLINVLIKYAIGTGAIIIAFSVAVLIMNKNPEKGQFNSMMYMLTGSLYANCYLAGMNSRERLRESEGDLVSLHLSHIASSSDQVNGTVDSSNGVQVAVMSETKSK